MKGVMKKQLVTRQNLADPYSHMSYHQRLVNADAVSLKDNKQKVDLGNGYCRIRAVDKTKKVK